jgi:hypothetical protein
MDHLEVGGDTAGPWGHTYNRDGPRDTPRAREGSVPATRTRNCRNSL